MVLDATCTPRRQFFWRTLSFGVRLRAARGETEDIEPSGRFTARSFDRNPAKGGENLAQVIVPTDLPPTLLHDEEKNRQTFNQNCLESDEEFSTLLICLSLNRTFGYLRIYK